VLAASGGVMIWSTVDIQDNHSACDHEDKGGSCQHFELKIAAASVTIANAIFYLLATPKSNPEEATIHSYPHDPAYEHPLGPVYVVPRAQIQPITINQYTPTTHTSYQPIYPAVPSYQASVVSSVPKQPVGWGYAANRYLTRSK